MTEIILRASGLRKKFGQVQALKNVNLEIKRNRVTIFLGENGAGKTTTIKILLGFLLADGGSIDKSQEICRLGYVPEQPIFFPWLKGREVLEVTAKLYGLDQKELDAKIEAVASSLSFNLGQLDRRVQTYSHGNQKKMAYLQNLLVNPDLLIVDEPFAALDPVTIKEIRDIFLEMKKQGRTLFLSSHLLAEAEKLADEVIIIKKGETLLQVDWMRWIEESIYLKTKRETLAGKILLERWPQSRLGKDCLENFVSKKEWAEWLMSLNGRTKEAVEKEVEISRPSLEAFFLFWAGI